MKKINKWCVFCFALLALAFYILCEVKTNKMVTVLDEVKLQENLENSIAIYVEKEDKTGYIESTSSIFPTNNYLFNSKLSGCVDANGYNKSDLLTYNYKNNTVGIKSNGSVQCFIYFDFLFDGLGTEDSPYLIQNIEDLVELSSSVNLGNSYDEMYFSLTNTLDFEDSDSYEKSVTKDFGDINNNGVVEELIVELTTGSGFIPIGNVSNNFKGNFDGNNNKIENLYIENNNSELTRIGLFGQVQNSTISNLGISGLVKTNVVANVGAFVGDADDSVIINCYNEAKIYSGAGSYSIGGLAGAFDGTIKNSYNIGDVFNGNNTGGLVGITDNLLVESCYNIGSLNKEGIGNHLGGLIGRDTSHGSNLVILNSYNSGEINFDINDSATNNIGGIVGRIYGTIEINNSFNESDIITASGVYRISNQIVGGLIGFLSSGYAKIKNSNNVGNIQNGLRVGGVIGYLNENSKSVIYNSINYGNISSDMTGEEKTTAVGGIVGYNGNGSTSLILNTINYGNVSSVKEASGFVGSNNFEGVTKIINSFNYGNTTSKNNHGSGILNFYSGSVLLNNVYNIGESNYGLSYISSDVSYNISNSYYQNTVSTNLSDAIGTYMTEEEFKNSEFINKLNSNISNIDLSLIDEELVNYKLYKWKSSENGYPTLDFEG